MCGSWAEALADRCCRLLNGEELDSVDIPSSLSRRVDQDDDYGESSDWDMSEEESLDAPVARPGTSRRGGVFSLGYVFKW